MNTPYKSKWELKHILMIIAMILLYIFAAYIDGKASETEDATAAEYENYYYERTLCHERIMPYEEYVISVDKFDPVRRQIALKFDHPVFASPTDSMCQHFMEIVAHITRDGWTLVIMNPGWVPCPSHVMSNGLALKILANPF